MLPHDKLQHLYIGVYCLVFFPLPFGDLLAMLAGVTVGWYKEYKDTQDPNRVSDKWDAVATAAVPTLVCVLWRLKMWLW